MRRVFKNPVNNEGSILVVALFMMCILMIVGMAAATTALIEQRLSGNQKFQKMAFYAAESGRNYVESHPELYGDGNLSLNSPHFFPDASNVSERYDLNGNLQQFNGSVEYKGSPRGSGTETGTFKIYEYQMTCYGYGPANAESKVEAGFYRLGY